MTPHLRQNLEYFSDVAGKWTLITIVGCNLVPTVLLSMIALLQGVVTGEFPRGGGLGASENFPPFDPQLWMAWIPIAIYATWVVATIPLPLKRQKFGRGFMLIDGALIFGTSLARIPGFVWSDRVLSWGTQYAFVAILVIMGVLVLRILLGWLRLVPKSWRVAPAQAPLRHVPQGGGDAERRMEELQRFTQPRADVLPGGEGARQLRDARRFDGATTCSTVLIVLITVVMLVFLLIWAVTQDHWAMVAMLVCGAILAVLIFGLMLTYVISLVMLGAARRTARREKKERSLGDKNE